MNKFYSIKSIVFLRFIFLFSLFFILLSHPVLAKANEIEKNGTEISKDEALPAAKLNLKAVSLVKGKTYTLKVYNLTEGQTVTFKSDTEDIASVDDSGLVTGSDFGTTIITVTIKEGNKVISKLTCDITVGPPAISVKFTRTELNLVVGKKFTLKALRQPYNTVEEAKFFSDDNSIATVSTGGRVTAISAGTTYIYAFLDNWKYDICTITVTEEVLEEEVTITPTPTDLPVLNTNTTNP